MSKYKCRNCGSRLHSKYTDCCTDRDIVDDLLDIGVAYGAAKLIDNLFDSDSDSSSSGSSDSSSSSSFDGFGGGSFGGGGAGDDF